MEGGKQKHRVQIQSQMFVWMEKAEAQECFSSPCHKPLRDLKVDLTSDVVLHWGGVGEQKPNCG